MKNVTIKNGYYARKAVNGTFQTDSEFKTYSPNNHKTGYAKTDLGYDGTIYVFFDGKRREVHVQSSTLVFSELQAGEVIQTPTLVTPANDLSFVSPEPVEVDLEKLGKTIAARFQVMDISCEAIIENKMRGLVISGAPGVGKTFTFERELQAAEDEGRITKFTHVKGKLTPLMLYQTLFENKEEGDVLLLDDTDSVFEDPIALNILKAALDTSCGFVSYGSTSKYLAENDLPNTFLFQGAIVFITNYDFDRLINSGNKMAPHFKALASRTTYLDLKIHTKLEIMVRVEQVALDSGLLAKKGIPDDVAKDMMEWLWDNYENMRELSVRTLLKLVEYNNINDWKFLAENFMLLG